MKSTTIKTVDIKLDFPSDEINHHNNVIYLYLLRRCLKSFDIQYLFLQREAGCVQINNVWPTRKKKLTKSNSNML